MTRNSMQNFLT